MENLGLTLLKNKKTRSLLIHSETIKGYPTILSFIRKTEEVTDEIIDTLLSESDKRVVYDLFPTIVESCHNEWRGNPDPEDVLDGDDRVECTLCGRDNKLIFYIHNIMNGKRINVGSTCINLFTHDTLFEGKSKAEVIKKARRNQRLRMINEKIPGIKRIMDNWEDDLKKYDVLIPSYIEKEYLEIGLHASRIFNDYLDKKADKSVFDEISVFLEKRNELIFQMEVYCKEHINNRFVVTRKIVQQLERDSDGETIKELKKTGYISSKTAPKIREEKFIKDLEIDFKSMLETLSADLQDLDYYNGVLKITPFSDKPLLILTPIVKFLTYFGWVIFKDEKYVGFTMSNLLRISKVTDIASIEYIISSIDFLLGKSNKVRLYLDDYDNKYDRYEFSEMDIHDLRNDKYVTVNLHGFIDDFKLALVNSDEWVAGELIKYVDNLSRDKYSRYTLEELKEKHYRRIYRETERMFK
ncbi:hypothetical protein [Brevibacillus sp. NRS-1366]|uniref:hypothetical protein n=1 Tax=Brevibacillus sp. NRS-1366 TaxID=3233899 RepID=UPI003D229067